MLRAWLSSPRQILTAVGVCAGVLVAAHVINEFTADGKFLRIDTEQNIATWLSSGLFLLAGVACFLRGALSDSARRSWARSDCSCSRCPQMRSPCSTSASSRWAMQI